MRWTGREDRSFTGAEVVEGWGVAADGAASTGSVGVPTWSADSAAAMTAVSSRAVGATACRGGCSPAHPLIASTAAAASSVDVDDALFRTMHELLLGRARNVPGTTANVTAVPSGVR